MNSKECATIIKGYSIRLFQKDDDKIGIERCSITSLSTLLNVEDWEWFYLSKMLINHPHITIKNIAQIILAVHKEKNIDITGDEIADLILINPGIINKRLNATVTIQKWFKRKLAVRRIEKWWIHHCYKPGSMGEKRVSKHFIKIQQNRGKYFLI